ncbi:MAG TPA: 30S ribosomal protein S12 methylthiotransferase RimO [Propionibacteriaceae bacterium]|nr:30S ribosomal protein S12 methylthiotransferase RimO [Propionibacteriaceae bacterium]
MVAPSSPTVHVLTLGCARNEVDSEELAGRLAGDGFRLVAEAEAADAVLVNTCGFIDAAKKDSVDALLAAADLKDNGRTRAVLAVGCMAERYGAELAEALPEADAVLGFDAYADMAATVRSVLAGDRPQTHRPRDRRQLLPLTPVDRPTAASALAVPGHGPASGPRPLRHRLAGGATAPVKIASGCDRRCTFCAIPRFRGAYLSRPVAEVVAEVGWLVTEGVREVFLVSENTTSYGKDLGDIRLLEQLLVELSAIDRLEWIRVSYLQPAELRPSLVAAITDTDKVVPYFDLSFQHAAPAVLRRMRRFGDPDAFLDLIDKIRAAAPRAGIRSNVICGFPGETDADQTVLHDFLVAAELDAVGVFGYSDEDGTEAARHGPKHSEEEIEARRSATADLVEELTSQRAAARLGEPVRVLVEEVDGVVTGRAAHQGPEVDGTVSVTTAGRVRSGDFLDAVVVGSEGVDLVAEV